MRDETEILVGRLRSGIEREESARRLDALLRPRLARYFGAVGVPAAEIDDLVQETLIRVFQHVGGLRTENRFVSWLFTIARNVGRSTGRRRQRSAAVTVEEAALEQRVANGLPPPDLEREARERLARVERGIAELPPQQRRCLVLVVRDELSYREVGDLLGVSPLTVRNHLAGARRKLREMVEVGEVQP